MHMIPESEAFDDTARTMVDHFYHKYRLGNLLHAHGARKAKGIAPVVIFRFLFSLVFTGRRMGVKEIFRACRKRRRRSRYLISVEVEVGTEDGHSIPATLVFVRNRDRRNEYLVLVSTDLGLDEDGIIRLYGKRWAIECFFKVCKTYLRLEKGCASLDYDAITARVAIVFAQYMMLSENQRLHADKRSIGDLCFSTVEELQDVTYEDAILLLLSAIFDAVAETFELSEEARERLLETFLEEVPLLLRNRLAKCA